MTNSKIKTKVTAAPPAIRLRGGRVHNLKNIDIDIPLGALVCICGVSGSGKTSLAFDTLYAEGQRRYIESFSSYTRQFLQQLDRPEYDTLENLPPSIAVTRKGASRNNRSIVSASTEIDDYLRLLYAKIATLHCYVCGSIVGRETAASVFNWIEDLQEKYRALVAFEIKWDDATDLALQLAHLQASGFIRLIASGKTFNISQDNREELADSVAQSDSISIVVDRLQVGSDTARWAEALQNAFEWGEGKSLLYLQTVGPEWSSEMPYQPAAEVQIDATNYLQFNFHEELICNTCGTEYPTPDQRLFSFNSPVGACPRCEGLAEVQELDMGKIVPDTTKSLADGAIAPWTTPAYRHELDELLALAKAEKIDVASPYKSLSKRERDLVFNGAAKHKFGGLQGFFKWLDRKKYKMHVRIFAARWHSYLPCPQCAGLRLRPEALAFKIGGRSISQLNAMSVGELQLFIANLNLTEHERQAAATIIGQVTARLSYLDGVGLTYMQLNRPLRTLSGGEQTRVNLTSVLGSNLVSMLYVLDEPTVGLHPEDSQKLVDVIKKLRDRGNTVIVVEHETPLIQQCDYLIEVGPLASRNGGKVVFADVPNKLKSAGTLTSKYLYQKSGTIRQLIRQPKSFLKLSGCTGNNLKNVEVEFPLNVFCVISGVSGSGKSSLVNETLVPAILQRLKQPIDSVLPYEKLIGSIPFDDCILIDQGISSRSSRSVPVTMVKAFDEIRALFASVPEATIKQMTASHFSFNSSQGRCPTCEGNGQLEIDMIFLANVHVVCPDCHGHRFGQDVLSIRYRDRNISQTLEMSVAEAIDFFRGSAKIQERLSVLSEVGLDYIQLGQSSSTLSAGELQRLKLANYLLDTGHRRSLIVMDEPTTGLHFYDVEKLIACMHKLVERGNSLIVVEHNEQILNAADWIIDIGPGAAQDGGQIVAAGPPAMVAQCRESKTAYHLRR